MGKIRFIIVEADYGGFIAGLEELVVMPGIAPAPFYSWQSIEGSCIHVATWSEAEQWIRRQKNKLLVEGGI